jgi:hypothetical protein
MTIEVRADLVTKMLHVRRYAENFAGVNRDVPDEIGR